MNVGGIDAGRIEAMISQLRAAAQRPADALTGVANMPNLGADLVKSTQRPDFADALKNQLNQVNQSQIEAQNLGKNFAMGDDSVSLSDVMIAGQKANINFQATLQVRNKMISAYQEIMNMQV